MRDPKITLKIAMLASELTWFTFISVSRLAKTRGNCASLKILTLGETTKISNRLVKTQTFPFAIADFEGSRMQFTISLTPSKALQVKIVKPEILDSDRIKKINSAVNIPIIRNVTPGKLLD
jgi:hypothetical protein